MATTEFESEVVEVEEEKFAYDSLESVRKKLLDLTNNNRLLSFRFPKTGCVRIVDELPNQVAKELKTGKAFSFLPVPEPTEKQLVDAGYITIDSKTGEKTAIEFPPADKWAKHLGFHTSYELPTEEISEHSAGNHDDSNLHTLLYPPALEARLRALRSQAETAIEESGANILYLNIGFLEWYESRDSDKARIAPLFTLPVRLERGSLDKKDGVYRYTITIKDEGLLTNVTLREKLLADFELFLPEIEEDTEPETYFRTIEESFLKQHPRWKVRREITLVLLDFAKQVMYQDLDPNNWPNDASIENHKIVEQFFSASRDDHGDELVSVSEEHDIDSIAEIHQNYPIVYEADSSQHSAMIDAVKGENLVIIGPPGTGKSQTISNIIAACIANGQRVLFVAEKMAALNVVKDRLDKAGLGDFCLELHSHKTNKQKILHDLNSRLDNQGKYRLPSEIGVDIERFEDLRQRLRDYVELINSKWRDTGLTIHQILNRATLYREKLQVDPNSFYIEAISGRDTTPLRQRELFDQSLMLASIFEQVSQQASNSEIAKHYWYGVNDSELAGLRHDEFVLKLEHWNNQLQALETEWTNQVESLQLGIDANDTVDAIEKFAIAAGQLPAIQGTEPLAFLGTIAKHQQGYREMLDTYVQIHKKIKVLSTVLKPDVIARASTADTLEASLSGLFDVGLDRNDTISTTTVKHDSVVKVIASAEQVDRQYQGILPHIPEALRPAFELSLEGLTEFLTLTRLVSALPSELWQYRDAVYDDPSMDLALDTLSQELSDLVPLHEELKERFSLSDLPSSASLRRVQAILARGSLLRWFSKEWRSAKRDLMSLSLVPKARLGDLMNAMPKLIRFANGMESINEFNQESSLSKQIYRGVNTPIDRHCQLRKWYKDVRGEYGIGFGSRVSMGQALLEMNHETAMGLSHAAQQSLRGSAHELLGSARRVQEEFPSYVPIANSRFNLCQGNSPLIHLSKTLEQYLRTLCNVVSNHDAELFKLLNARKYVLEVIGHLTEWRASSLVQQLVPAALPLSLEPDHFSSSTLATAQTTLAIAEVADECPPLSNAIEACPGEERYKAILLASNTLELLIANAIFAEEQFLSAGGVNLAEWTEVSGSDLKSLRRRNDQALAEPKWLETWLEYIDVRKRLSADGLQRVIGELESKNLSSKDLSDVVRLALYHQLSLEALKEHQELARFRGIEQVAIRERFQEYDKKLLKLQREKIAYSASRRQPPKGIGSGRIRDYTETSLIRHHAGLQRPRIAVRTILKQAGNAIQTIKPCFMMSPMSVAQYLEPGGFTFDIVIMDEASQIRPEDALGAIARGKSVVVVGDPKQLPPTSFFHKTVDGDDGDETVGLQVSESILDCVGPMFNHRPLLWHYRSRHESLIAFSNQHFYDSKLILFPSPFQDSEEFGVRLTKVPKGRFSDRRNVEEAREVVNAVAKHLLERLDESIGVVAMNGEQRDEIVLQLDQLTKDNDRLRKAREKNEDSDEPLFVKNLENVQGDERDVIAISMTYGPEQVGASTMHQRFGPVNTEGGWRRLNVLFTRSKKRMHVFSTMESGHINVGASSRKGVQALKNWLEYCESGHLHHIRHTGKPVDSDFEMALIKALGEHGYDCEPQLGVAGYFLDVAVKDPGQPGRFLMGIECDGATYHSAKSTRDRDRLRQEILERLGWKIRRVWSTDWFKNPQAQLQPILNELEQLRSEPGVTESLVNEVGPDEVAEVAVTNGYAEENSFEQFLSDDAAASKQAGLRELLVSFDKNIIRTRLPETELESRLLSTAMLDALLNHKPRSIAEFKEVIPQYLRNKIEPDEAEFLEPVLKLVASYA